MAYSPLGRGFLAGRYQKLDDLAEDDWRRGMPRFQGENFKKNLEVVERVKEIAVDKNVTPAQLALAWVLGRGSDVVPIPGTTKRSNLEANIAAAQIDLSEAEFSRIEEVAPKGVAVGTRYPEAAMRMVDL